MKESTKKLRLQQIKSERLNAVLIMIAGVCFIFSLIGTIIGAPMTIWANNKLNRLKIEENELID